MCLTATVSGLSPRKGRRAGQHLVEHDAQRVEVAAPVGAAVRLLGRHVLGRADQQPAFGHARPLVVRTGFVARDVAQAGDAEVEHLDQLGVLALVAGAADDHDVLGLEIAVHDAHVVRHADGGQHLRQDVDDARVGQRRVLADHLVERPPLDVLHRQVQQRAVVVLAEVEHAHRVGVLEARGGARLSLEALEEVLVARELLAQQLERDHAVQPELARAVHRADPSRGDHRLDHELAGDGLADARGTVAMADRHQAPGGSGLRRPESPQYTVRAQTSPATRLDRCWSAKKAPGRGERQDPDYRESGLGVPGVLALK